MSAPAYTDDDFAEFDTTDTAVDVERIGVIGTSEIFDHDGYLAAISDMRPHTVYMVSTHHPRALTTLLDTSFLPEGTDVHVGAVVTDVDTAHRVITEMDTRTSFVHFAQLEGPAPREIRDALAASHVRWVVVGSSECTHAMHPDWVRDLRDFCVLAGISFSFFGWGSWVENTIPCGEERVVRVPREVSSSFCAVHVTGKLAMCPSNPHNPFVRGEAGWTVLRRASVSDDISLLDGKVWDEAPFDLMEPEPAR